MCLSLGGEEQCLDLLFEEGQEEKQGEGQGERETEGQRVG